MRSNQSVKHFNGRRNSFNSRVVVSARRLEELDARGKKELVEVDEIEVSGRDPEVEWRTGRRGCPSGRSLSLAPDRRPAKTRRGGGATLDFISPAGRSRSSSSRAGAHYERVVRAAMEARRSVWIATANLKELMVEDDAGGAGAAAHRRARAGARRAATVRSWTCSTSWPRGASSCASCTRRPLRVHFAPRCAGTPRLARALALRACPRAPLQDGHRGRRVRLRGQRQLDRGRAGRQGDGTAQLRARVRRAETTGCWTGSRACSIASGAAPNARPASCATLCPRPLDAPAGKPRNPRPRRFGDSL